MAGTTATAHGHGVLAPLVEKGVSKVAKPMIEAKLNWEKEGWKKE